MDKILVTDGISGVGQNWIDHLRNHAGIDLVIPKSPLTPEQLKEELAKGYRGIIIRGATKLTKDVLEAASGLEVIGRQGIGVDNVDLEAASRIGAYVLNTPGSNRHSVKQLVFTAIHHFYDSPHKFHAETVEGGFPKKKFKRRDITQASIGILGLGAIGYEVAKLARAWEMSVFGYDPSKEAKKDAKEEGVKIVGSIDVLFSQDIVTLHIPENEHTRGLIQQKHLNQLREGALLINCARSGILDENLVYETLLDRLDHPFFFAQDVFQTEKEIGKRRIPKELEELVLMTPHIGASSPLSQRTGSSMIIEQVVGLLRKRIVLNSVNFPKTDTEALPYMELARKIGFIANQFLGETPNSIESTLYNGADAFAEGIMIGAFAGALQEDGKIPYPTARPRAQEAGIVYERREVLAGKEGRAYKNAMTLDLVGNKKRVSIRGRITPDGFDEITRIDIYDGVTLVANYEINFKPEGNLVVIEIGKDTPGTFGAAGVYIGEKRRNILRSAQATNNNGDGAILVFELDQYADITGANIPYYTARERETLGTLDIKNAFSTRL